MTDNPGPDDEATAQRAEPDWSISVPGLEHSEQRLRERSKPGAPATQWLNPRDARIVLAELDRLRRRDAADQLAREGQDMRLDEDDAAMQRARIEQLSEDLAWQTAETVKLVAERDLAMLKSDRDRLKLEYIQDEYSTALRVMAARLTRERREADRWQRRQWDAMGRVLTLRADQGRLMGVVNEWHRMHDHWFGEWAKANEELTELKARPSIPLDALRALANGEPLDEVAGDYGVPLDVVEQVAPWVGRKADLGAALDAIRSDLCVSAELEDDDIPDEAFVSEPRPDLFPATEVRRVRKVSVSPVPEQGREEGSDYSKPGDHHDNVCERRSGHEWPFCRCKDRAEVHEDPDAPNVGVLTSPKPGENFDIDED